jgi:multiple sugar transport system substrate-binding protein
MLKNKLLVLLIISFSLMMVLTVNTAAEEVELEFFLLGGQAEVDAQKEVVKMFEEDNPDIKVNTTWVPPENYYDKLKVRIASGNAPDIMRIVIEQYQDLADRGAFLDIKPYVEEDQANNPEFAAQMDDYFDILIDALEYNDSLYGLPGDWNNAVIFYNKDLFDEAGVEYPEADWTVEEFLAAARKLTKDTTGNGQTDQYGYLVTGDWFDCIAPWIFTFDGQILNDDWSQAEINSAEAIQGIKFINDLVNKYEVSPTPAVMKQFGGSQFFMTGKVAMAHYGRYMVPAFRQANFDWDIQEQPVGPAGGRGVPFGLAAISAAKGTEHPEAAYKFIKYFSSPKAVEVFNSLGNSNPVLESVTETDDFKNPELPPKNQYALIEAIEYSQLIPSPPGNNEIMDSATSVLDELLVTNEITPEEAANKIAEEINEILSE